ncbi:DUF5629 family protein [Pseudomonas weihenstephanensis]|uniref:DUF5629 domain-containing protein n=1 Tax=Pseudomonas weihenstephanensis TaxID=1608994 RepID=A0A0J6J095_9PSED|nr:DUF5629 family protein [Pseudomonas weihenstephanensis]KMN13267.1 hypothetical protein TU86_14465 [Pseudomonas weihenstephanensis]KMN17812.1 hypothetical protein TU87_14775 [Pseudomonas weihenstephanensis]MBM1191735.1 hypothetical protein [Pseudomonas weihenstephanensis]GLX91001.1 hypothetical protein Pfra02_35690 [Pseudomonas fragi]
MSDSNQTLRTALETSDMLVIDGLHAWEFSLDDVQLLIKCMDGRAEKRWSFKLAQLDAAVFDETLQSWTLIGDSGEHRLVCLCALKATNDDDDCEVADEA